MATFKNWLAKFRKIQQLVLLSQYQPTATPHCVSSPTSPTHLSRAFFLEYIVAKGGVFLWCFPGAELWKLLVSIVDTLSPLVLPWVTAWLTAGHQGNEWGRTTLLSNYPAAFTPPPLHRCTGVAGVTKTLTTTWWVIRESYNVEREKSKSGTVIKTFPEPKGREST